LESRIERLPDPLAGWLDRRAEALGCSQSDLVRQARELGATTMRSAEFAVLLGRAGR